MTAASTSRRFIGVAVVNGLQTAINLATGILSARVLDAAGRGEYASVAVYATVIGTLLPAGVPQALVTWRGRLSSVKGGLWGYVIMVVPLGGGILLFLHLLGIVRTSGIAPLAGGSMMVIGGTYAAVSTGLYQRAQDFGLGFRTIRLAPALFLVAYMTVFAITGVHNASLWLLLSGLCMVVPSTCILVIVLRRALSQSDAPSPLFVGRSFIPIAARASLIVLTAQVFFRIDSMVAASRLGFRELGYYAVAFGAQAALVSVATVGALLVHADLATCETGLERMRQVMLAERRTLALVLGLSVPAVVAGPLIIPLVYGAGFSDAVTVTQVLCLGAVPIALDYVYLHGIMVLGLERRLIGIQLALGAVGFAIYTAVPASGTGLPLATSAVGIFSVSCLIKRSILLRTISGQIARDGRARTRGMDPSSRTAS
ncbi:MAG TPA: hypothetical protein VHO29_06760 [Marmoricola sp.]|nr:hypothetical protein [Marmoricola sp.]